MSEQNKAEIGIDGDVLEQARKIALSMQEGGIDNDTFTLDKQCIGNKPTFCVSRKRGDLFVLTSIDVNGETFYLGTQK